MSKMLKTCQTCAWYDYMEPGPYGVCTLELGKVAPGEEVHEYWHTCPNWQPKKKTL